MKVVLVFTLLSFAAAAGANNQPNLFVVNGTPLTADQIPQMAKLKANSWNCSATLIGPRVILTAAHCVAGHDGIDTRQTFGPIKGKRYSVKLTAHPKYLANMEKPNLPDDLAYKYDIAVGILSSVVTTISPISVTKIIPNLADITSFAGTGLPSLTRQYGFAAVIAISPIGLTLRGYGTHPQVVALGDSGGPNFIRDALDELTVFAITSTGTQKKNGRKAGRWFEILPLSIGVTRIFPDPQSSDTFFEDFVRENSLEVCGMNITCPAVVAP